LFDHWGQRESAVLMLTSAGVKLEWSVL
jgi:hypothetical protein